MAHAGPLQNLKILDLTHHRAGPFCTKLFTSFGAQVLKVERVGCGDGLRNRGPFHQNIPGVERSLPFHWLNGGKQSLSLDLKKPAAKDILWRLIDDADVLIENFSPGVMARLGFGYEDVQARKPQIVMTSISNFGQDGPYRDFKADEKILYAMSGAMASTGDRDRPPLASGPAITQYTAGLHAYIATLMALIERRTSGQGDAIDVSIQESAIENIEVQLAEFLQSGKVAKRNGDEHPLVPWRCYPCEDGYAAIISGPLRHWGKAAELFESPELASPELAHMAARIARRRDVEAMIKPWLMRHRKQDIYHQGQAIGLAFGYLAGLDDILESTHLQARNFFSDTEAHPVVGRLSTCGPVFRLDGDIVQDRRRAPMLGEHNRPILLEQLEYSAQEVAAFESQGVI